MAHWNETSQQSVFKVVVAGRSNSGKSTFLKALSWLLREETESFAPRSILRWPEKSDEIFEFLPVEIQVSRSPACLNFVSLPVCYDLYRDFVLLDMDVLVFVGRPDANGVGEDLACLSTLADRMELLGGSACKKVLFLNQSGHQSFAESELAHHFDTVLKGNLSVCEMVLECVDAVQAILQTSLPLGGGAFKLTTSASQHLSK